VAVCRAGVDVGAVVEAKQWQSASLSSSFCILSDSFGPLLQPLALLMKAFGTVDHCDTPGGRIRYSFCAGELVCSPVIPSVLLRICSLKNIFGLSVIPSTQERSGAMGNR
jgi:hypothetical protein